MTSPGGIPDPGDPKATDEEAIAEKFAQENPVAPEAAVVTDGVTGVHTDEVKEALADNENPRGEFK